MATDAGRKDVQDESKAPALPEVRELTPEEGWALFDELAQRHLGIDGVEFIRR